MINYSHNPRPIFDPSESIKTQLDKLASVPAAFKPVSQFPFVAALGCECAEGSGSLELAALPLSTAGAADVKRDESVNMIVGSRKSRERFAIKKSYSIEVKITKILCT